MKRVLWLWIVCLGVVFGGRSMADDCPDQKATNVPPEVIESADKKTCGLGIQIFGIGGSIIGESCPKWMHFIPAHSDCLGAALVGYECRPVGTFAVERQVCDCGGLVLPFIETGIPTTCECSDPVNAGSYITYGTYVCEGSTPPTSGAGGTPNGRRRGPAGGAGGLGGGIGGSGGGGPGWTPAPID
jgi:hypothetical protein